VIDETWDARGGLPSSVSFAFLPRCMIQNLLTEVVQIMHDYGELNQVSCLNV